MTPRPPIAYTCCALALAFMGGRACAELTPRATASNRYDVIFAATPLREVIQEFTRVSGANIIASGADLHGTVTIELQDVEWQPALRRILAEHGLDLIEKVPDTEVYSIVPSTRYSEPPQPYNVFAVTMYPSTPEVLRDILQMTAPLSILLCLGLLLLLNAPFAALVAWDTRKMMQRGRPLGIRARRGWIAVAIVLGLPGALFYWIWTHARGKSLARRIGALLAAWCVVQFTAQLTAGVLLFFSHREAVFWSEPSLEFRDGLAPVLVEGKWGCIDRDGRIVVEPKYAWLSRVHHGYVTVSLEKSAKYAFGFVDTAGNVLLAPRHGVWPHTFGDGLIVKHRLFRVGYINTNGTWSIPPRFMSAGPFHDGLACAYTWRNAGFIDRRGEFVIGPDFTSLGGWGAPFEDGPEPVYCGGTRHPLTGRIEGGRWGYVDRQGNRLCEPRFEQADPFEQGFARVATSTGWGFINLSGRLLTAQTFFDTRNFAEGRAAVQVQDRVPGYGGWWGYIDTNGTLAIEARFASAESFKEGLARVETTGEDRFVIDPSKRRWGYVDRHGAMVIPAEFVDARDFHEGLAAVKIGPDADVASGRVPGKWGYVNAKGLLMIEAMFDWAGDFACGRAVVRNQDKYGVIDRYGHFIVFPELDYAEDRFREDRLAVVVGEYKPYQTRIHESDCRLGYIDIDGKYVWVPSR